MEAVILDLGFLDLMWRKVFGQDYRIYTRFCKGLEIFIIIPAFAGIIILLTIFLLCGSSW